MLKFLKTNSKSISPDVFIEKFSGKRILVMGSGPSVNERRWQNIEIDSICTTSFFYLNEEIRNLKTISHITLTDLVNLTDDYLIQFLDTNQKVTVAFEPKDHPFYKSREYLWFNERYEDRIVLYNTEYGMKEGVAGRLCYFVLSFNPSEMYYIGIDGKSQNGNQDPNNAFRSHLKGDADNYSFNDFLTSHEYFAKNIDHHSKLSGTKIFNLGEGLPYNLSTTYSLKNFPLSEYVLSKVIHK